MHDQIRSWEHRAEQLAVRIEELAEQPDITRIAVAGVFAAAAVCWFAVAWGEGLLLLGLPVLAGACIVLTKRRRAEHEPSVEAHERELGAVRPEIDQWLTRLANSAPRAEPDPFRPVFQAPAPALDVRVATPPAETPVPPTPFAEPAEPRVEPVPELPVRVEHEPEPAATTIFEVAEIRAGARILLEVRSTFDSAVDAAFDLIAERDPPELEIDRVTGDEREPEWRYDREAAANLPRGSLDLYGFDATRWTGVRR